MRKKIVALSCSYNLAARALFTVNAHTCAYTIISAAISALTLWKSVTPPLLLFFYLCIGLFFSPSLCSDLGTGLLGPLTRSGNSI